jgi:RNA polymerase sigma-70 factor (ECF subfamily)
MMDRSNPRQPLAAPAQPDLPAGADARGPAAATLEIGPLIVAHHAALYRYAYRLSGCQADAEDLTQQTFLVAQQKLHQLREADRVASWLYAVLRSCYLKQCRKRHPPGALTVNLPLEEIAEQEITADDIDREALQAALGELPDEFRVVVLMFYFEELSYKEIAEQLEIPMGTVMSRLSRGKQHLRTSLMADERAVAGGERKRT